MIVRYGFLTPGKDIEILEGNHSKWLEENLHEIIEENLHKYKSWIKESKTENILDFCTERLGWILVGLYSPYVNIRVVRLKLQDEKSIYEWQKARISEYMMYSFEVDYI